MNLDDKPKDFIELIDRMRLSNIEHLALSQDVRDEIKGIIYNSISNNQDVRAEMYGYTKSPMPEERMSEIISNIKNEIRNKEHLEIQSRAHKYSIVINSFYVYGYGDINPLEYDDFIPVVMHLISTYYYIRHIAEDFIVSLGLEESWRV